MNEKARRILDFTLFPLRALFAPEQRLWGLSSLREERMREVAHYVKGRCLDIGCGPENLFVKKFCGLDSVGMDFYPYPGVEIVHQDATNLPFASASFETVTLIAVGGHIPQSVRVDEFREIARILKPKGNLLMTEGEPITQTIGHIWRRLSFALVGKKDMDTERGMDKSEQYCMPHNELKRYLNTYPLKIIKKIKFMWGLNNLYIAQKSL